jgi:hypothetical protein
MFYLETLDRDILPLAGRVDLAETVGVATQEREVMPFLLRKRIFSDNTYAFLISTICSWWCGRLCAAMYSDLFLRFVV